MRAGAYTLHRHECMALSNDSQWMMSSPRGRERGTVGGWPGSGIIPCRARADQAKKKRMRLLRRGVGHRSEPRQRQPQPAVGEPAIAGPGSPLPTWPDGRWPPAPGWPHGGVRIGHRLPLAVLLLCLGGRGTLRPLPCSLLCSSRGSDISGMFS